jgi:histidinol-phosphate/aromatic aminotransferase/cobyric acid decarboxylase-like protein
MGLPVEKILKLASNENPLGMSPKAKKAVEKRRLPALSAIPTSST